MINITLIPKKYNFKLENDLIIQITNKEIKYKKSQIIDGLIKSSKFLQIYQKSDGIYSIYNLFNNEFFVNFRGDEEIDYIVISYNELYLYEYLKILYESILLINNIVPVQIFDYKTKSLIYKDNYECFSKYIENIYKTKYEESSILLESGQLLINLD